MAFSHGPIVIIFMKLISLVLVSVALLLGTGCGRKGKDITELERKEAANLVSEAQFALTLRDFARAEPLLARAAELCPDTGDYWLSLGVTRVRLGNKAGAKSAYEEALSVYRDRYDNDAKQTDAVLQQVYVLALLGRPDDARQTLEKAHKKDPESRGLRMFVEDRQIDRILEDPAFKEVAL